MKYNRIMPGAKSKYLDECLYGKQFTSIFRCTKSVPLFKNELI